MRQVANQKMEMNGNKAQGRVLANGRDGHVLLGGLVLPECVLQGRGLRALLDAHQQVTPVEGLIQGEGMTEGGTATCLPVNAPPRCRQSFFVHSPLALWQCCVHGRSGHAHAPAFLAALGECVAPHSSSCSGMASTAGDSGTTRQHGSPYDTTIAGTRAAQGAEDYVDGLSRNTVLAAPPGEFLALMTDWHSARTNSTAQKQ
jgi:hypothetical protein